MSLRDFRATVQSVKGDMKMTDKLQELSKNYLDKSSGINAKLDNLNI